MNILILGHKKHGKDFLAKTLHSLYKDSLDFKSSTMIYLENIIKKSYIYSKYNNDKECFEDRVNRRGEWFKEISKYKKNNGKNSLVRMVLSHSNIKVGTRCKYEYEDEKKFFDLIFWVENPNLEKESKESMTLKFNPNEMIFIKNDFIEGREKNSDNFNYAIEKVGLMIDRYKSITSNFKELKHTCMKLDVSSVIFDNNNRQWYGSNYSDVISCKDNEVCYEVNGHCSSVRHAEENAIDNYNRSVSTKKHKYLKMLVTHAPCKKCIKLINELGIDCVMYVNDYKVDVLSEEYNNVIKTKIKWITN